MPPVSVSGASSGLHPPSAAGIAARSQLLQRVARHGSPRLRVPADPLACQIQERIGRNPLICNETRIEKTGNAPVFAPVIFLFLSCFCS
jgi:hypothetical protein